MNLAHKADYERHRHVKRWTKNEKRLRAQPSKRTDTNPWLLHRSKKTSTKHPFQNRSFELFARHGWRIEQVRVDWRVYFLKSAGKGQKAGRGESPHREKTSNFNS